ncbi:MAG: UDP-N-acetylmuramoyl-L-alanine--D-glutamate ligase [Candidatus Omnitrophica bacterium]|nr:UDP-N-acetylmuramoyl-L-alanine--D-glutamate ligase [Candidatus Omnitrophota bacterium]
MKKKKTLVIGLGISGFAAAKFLLARGVPVVCVDSNDTETLRSRARTLEEHGAEVQLGVSDPTTRSAEQVVVSPGVPSRILKTFIDRKIPVYGELEIGCREVSSPIIAVTGTNGKSTVVETINAGLNQAGKKSFALGNLGTPVTEWVDSKQDADYLTLEVSSYQLETIEKFHPSVAVVLNIAPDHLSWHGSMESYLKAKSRITQNQTIEDALLLHKDLSVYPILQKTRGRLYWFGRDLDPSRDGLSLAGDLLEWRGAGPHWKSQVKVDHLFPHEVENLLGAVSVLLLLGIEPDQAITLFEHPLRLPHRIEEVGVHRGVRYLNDSKSTNCHSAIAALKAVPTDSIWLVGGQGKGEDLSELAHIARDHEVRLAICFGRDGEIFSAGLDPEIQTRIVPTMREAFDLAAAESRDGDTVLLSPAAASFDEFQSFEDRGEHFRKWVNDLKGKES